jgi:hypothetical protein
MVTVDVCFDRLLTLSVFRVDPSSNSDWIVLRFDDPDDAALCDRIADCTRSLVEEDSESIYSS